MAKATSFHSLRQTDRQAKISYVNCCDIAEQKRDEQSDHHTTFIEHQQRINNDHERIPKLSNQRNGNIARYQRQNVLNNEQVQ